MQLILTKVYVTGATGNSDNNIHEIIEFPITSTLITKINISTMNTKYNLN
jgi:hypothetical protein